MSRYSFTKQHRLKSISLTTLSGRNALTTHRLVRSAKKQRLYVMSFSIWLHIVKHKVLVTLPLFFFS